MGIIRQHIRLANVARDDLEEIDALALVDTGAMDLCVPRHVVYQLRLRIIKQREVIYADGRREILDYVGPIRVEAFGRNAFTEAMVTGDSVLLGAIPMQAMDVLIDPRRERVIPNPENPNIPGAIAMGFTLPVREED